MSGMAPADGFLSSRATTNVLLLVLTTVVAAGSVANGAGVPGGFADVADLVLVGSLLGPPFVLLIAFVGRGRA